MHEEVEKVHSRWESESIAQLALYILSSQCKKIVLMVREIKCQVGFVSDLMVLEDRCR
jgi:hypothetical protein